MFNFSKKKENLQPPQPPQSLPNPYSIVHTASNNQADSNNNQTASNNNQNFPINNQMSNNNQMPNDNTPVQSSTKVEDDRASFEIPDFTEEDLNFDLGIGDLGMGALAPSQETNKPVLPEPKGMPIDVPPSAVQSQSAQQTLQPVFPPPAPEIYGDSQVKSNKNSYEQYQQEEDDIQKNKDALNLQAEKNTLNSPDTHEEKDVAEDEIPKFDVKPMKYINNMSEDLKKESKKEVKPREIIKETKKNIIPLKLDSANAVPVQSQGIFLSNGVFEKTVILSEDTLKKSLYGEGVKLKMSSLMDLQKQSLDDLGKVSKSVLDLLLNCDARLFEKGDEK